MMLPKLMESDCFYNGTDTYLAPIRCFECNKVFKGDLNQRFIKELAKCQPVYDTRNEDLETLIKNQAEWVQDENTVHDIDRLCILLHLFNNQEVGNEMIDQLTRKELLTPENQAMRRIGLTRPCCHKNFFSSFSHYDQMLNFSCLNNAPNDYLENQHKRIIDETLNSHTSTNQSISSAKVEKRIYFAR